MNRAPFNWKGLAITEAEFWQGMRHERFIVVDFPGRKVAVYPVEDGHVVVASQEAGPLRILSFTVEEIGPLVSALLEAEHDARPKDALINAQYGAYRAIEKAKELK